MKPIVVFPDPPSDLARALDVTGRIWKIAESSDVERRLRPDAGWAAAIVIVRGRSDTAAAMVAALRDEGPDTPVLVVTDAAGLGALGRSGCSFDDFCVSPVRPEELAFRLERLTNASDGTGTVPDDLVTYGPLMINPVTYQAMVDGAPLDLTYMEYELLKYFAQHPGRVCTREVLLSQVWGYDYYGGARTVDVHVRRLRAKLGEPHAGLIETVRSVGYRFGRAQWG